jgi:uncharacterized DUF497 family protein
LKADAVLAKVLPAFRRIPIESGHLHARLQFVICTYKCQYFLDGSVPERQPALDGSPRTVTRLKPSDFVYMWHIQIMATPDSLAECIGFDWDESNTAKNWERHKVTPEEAEEVFFYEPLVVRSDVGHSSREKRYRAMGRTSRGRLLFVAFAIRRKLVRVVSVRDMNRRKAESIDASEEGS